jgi:hypothetical protein
MEAIITHPEDALQIMQQPDEKSTENKNRFNLKLNFTGKDRQSLWKRAPKDEKKTPPKDEKKSPEEKNTSFFSNLHDKKDEKKTPPKDEKKSPEEKNTSFFSNLRDKKASIFSKKNTKASEAPSPPSSSALGPLDETEWTIL